MKGGFIWGILFGVAGIGAFAWVFFAGPGSRVERESAVIEQPSGQVVDAAGATAAPAPSNRPALATTESAPATAENAPAAGSGSTPPAVGGARLAAVAPTATAPSASPDTAPSAKPARTPSATPAPTPPATPAPTASGQASTPGGPESGGGQAAETTELAPRFDVVRVDASGQTVIAGRAQPDQSVDILLDGQVVETVRADASGRFATVIMAGLSGDPRELRLRVTVPWPDATIPPTRDVATDERASAAPGDPARAAASASPETAPPVATGVADLSRPAVVAGPAPSATRSGAASATPAPRGAAADGPTFLSGGPAPPSAGGTADPAVPVARSEVAALAPPGAAPPAGTDISTSESAPAQTGAAPAMPGAGSPGAGAPSDRTLRVRSGEPAETAVSGADAATAPEARQQGTATARPAEPAGTEPAAPGTVAMLAQSRQDDQGVTVVARAEPPGASASVSTRTAVRAATGSEDAEPSPTAPAPAGKRYVLSAPVIILPSGKPDSAPALVAQKGEQLAMLQPAGGRAEGVVLDQITYAANGDLTLRGRAQPRHAVRVYANGRLIETVPVSDGAWTLSVPRDRAEAIQLFRFDELDGDGRVTSRIEAPFEYSGTSPQIMRDRKILVQKGDNLWRIAQQFYGEGIRYSVIYSANSKLIRDPDLIYPDQVFTIPELVDAK